jgi:hypothetical protein
MAPIHLVGRIRKEQRIATVTILQQAAPNSSKRITWIYWFCVMRSSNKTPMRRAQTAMNTLVIAKGICGATRSGAQAAHPRPK